MNKVFSPVIDNAAISHLKPGTKILMATFPADGHFNPLTGIAMHLKSLGCDVRWYTSTTYSEKLKKMGIPHYPFKIALDTDASKLDIVFPERKKYKSLISKLKFDLIHSFYLRAPEYYNDIKEIQQGFPFQLVIADVGVSAIPIIKEVLGIPVISVGIVPLMASSKDLPPYGFGMLPSRSFLGRAKQALIRSMMEQFILKAPRQVYEKVLADYNITLDCHLFDTSIYKGSMYLQSGIPSFEYKRSDFPKNVRFVGPILPPLKETNNPKWYNEKLNQYKKVILVTQGTVEKDVEKIIAPTLKAFKNTEYLVIVTTGGTETAALKKRFPESNFIIEDFIPFNDVMSYCDVYISNGGYGGVLLGIQNKLPMVVAGVHEGKNEICARVDYFKLGINLKTETPNSEQIKKAVEEVVSKPVYKNNVLKLAEEFKQFNPHQLIEKYIAEVLTP